MHSLVSESQSFSSFQVIQLRSQLMIRSARTSINTPTVGEFIMESMLLAFIFHPLRLLIVGLLVVLVWYLFFIENKYEKALQRLKNNPNNHAYFNEVMRIGREHMHYKRQQHVGHAGAIDPDMPREELMEEAYRLYGDDQIKADIYRVVGRSYY